MNEIIFNPENYTFDFTESYKQELINQIHNCEKIPVEKIFKYVCDKYNNWLIWYIPILVIWYIIIPIIANIIYKTWILRLTGQKQETFLKIYKILYESILYGIIFFGGIIWLYMSAQNGTFTFLGIII